MAKTFLSILKNSQGRFVSVTVKNSKIPETTASVKIVSVSPQYVTVREYDNNVRGLYADVKLHRNSIKRVSSR